MQGDGCRHRIGGSCAGGVACAARRSAGKGMAGCEAKKSREGWWGRWGAKPTSWAGPNRQPGPGYGRGVGLTRVVLAVVPQLGAQHPPVVLRQCGKGVWRLVVEMLARPAGEQVVRGSADGVLPRGGSGGARRSETAKRALERGAGAERHSPAPVRHAALAGRAASGRRLTLLGPHGRMPVR